MGRLIDADKLLNAFGLSEKTRKYGGDHSGYDTRMLHEIQDTIEDMGNVEAIPVPWIEKHLLSYLREDASVCDGIGSVYIRAMLEQWKEEQKG